MDAGGGWGGIGWDGGREGRGRHGDVLDGGRGRERGSGIGLAVCDEIVTRHGGRLVIGNAEGGGAQVCVDLPIKTQ